MAKGIGKTRQPDLFKVRLPPKKTKQNPKVLMDRARNIAFEITKAVERWPELDAPRPDGSEGYFRQAVHEAHEFVNLVKNGSPTEEQALKLLKIARRLKIRREIARLRKDRRSGQGQLF